MIVKKTDYTNIKPIEQASGLQKTDKRLDKQK